LIRERTAHINRIKGLLFGQVASVHRSATGQRHPPGVSSSSVFMDFLL
jgi:hypothetical protein